MATKKERAYYQMEQAKVSGADSMGKCIDGFEFLMKQLKEAQGRYLRGANIDDVAEMKGALERFAQVASSQLNSNVGAVVGAAFDLAAASAVCTNAAPEVE